MHGISQSMTGLGNEFYKSMEMLIHDTIMQSQPHHPVPQNMFFQILFHILAVTLLAIVIWQILLVKSTQILIQKMKIKIFQFAVKH